MKYTVYVIASVDSRQLLLVVEEGSNSLCVYDEHTGTTLMRRCACNIENLRTAVALL